MTDYSEMEGYDRGEESLLGEIGYCKCGKMGTLMHNPYAFDVHEEIVYEYLCQDCYEVSCDDI